jgi:uncharacterized membrane protein
MAADRPRLLWPDLARTAALIGMAVYHFGYDLEAFGRLAPGTMTSGFWAVFARAVAGSFIFLAGLSLWLGHGRGIRWQRFLVRLAKIAAGAVLVTAGTRYAFGPQYVFFGILHFIAVASLLGLFFLRWPAALILVAAAGAFLARDLFAGDPFNAPWLLWTGLATAPVHSVDFIPMSPWFAPFLAGVAAGRLAARADLWSRLPEAHRLAAFAWPGRHSLIIYLLHQPILIGIVWGLTRAGLL